ncbi:tetratricopeptide repeat protein [Roseomonas sp. BN140053]|uniref:tetratricopeptide repeat protein n=1 Tax=Roseomonas sp. BN140053 TaxID=3391898 RepID=UPI0039EA82FB
MRPWLLLPLLALVACSGSGGSPSLTVGAPGTATAAAAPDGRALLVGIARAKLRDGDAAGAETAFRTAVEALPRDAAARNGLGVSLDLQGRHDQAQASYREALAIEPGNAGARNNLALSLALSGRAPEAVGMLEPLAAAPGASDRSRHNLAVAYAARGDVARASRLLAPELGSSSDSAAAAWRAALAGT